MGVDVLLVQRIVDALNSLEPETAAIIKVHVPINDSTHTALCMGIANAGGKLMIQRAPLQESFAHLVPNLLLVYRPGLLPARHFENLCIALLPESQYMSLASFEAIARENERDPLGWRYLPLPKWLYSPHSHFRLDSWEQSSVEALLAEQRKEELLRSRAGRLNSEKSDPTGKYRFGPRSL